MVLTKVVFPFFTIIDFVSPSLALGKPSSVATHEELALTSFYTQDDGANLTYTGNVCLVNWNFILILYSSHLIYNVYIII